jgi:hypothetical protein
MKGTTWRLNEWLHGKALIGHNSPYPQTMHSGFKTAFSVHPAFQGHKHQNFVRTHRKASRIYPVYAISVPLTVRDIPGI